MSGADTRTITAGGVARRVGYAALFVVALPALLALWARRLNAVLDLPAYYAPVAGWTIAGAGAVLMAAAMRDLFVHGGGLPASPFPPERLVTRGSYRVFAHPVYVGAVLIAFGISIATESDGGLWIVTPTLTLSAAAFVMGFERDATRRRLGRAEPILKLPPPSDEPATLAERFSVFVLVFLPWLLLYQAVELLGVPPDAMPAYFDWERNLPVVPWSEAVYAGTYLFVLSAPWAAARARDLRRFAIDGLVATALIIPLYLLVPLIAPAKPVPGAGVWQILMSWERAVDAPVTAFPAFHVVWACIAARLWCVTSPRLKPAWWIAAAAIAVSCITTGMHAILDVLGGFAAALIVSRRDRLWHLTIEAAETIANAWREITVGPVRLMLHGVYAAAGAMAGVAIALCLAGSANLPWLIAMTIAAVLGAAMWAQLVEGSSELLRPFGYFGSVLGVISAALMSEAAGADGWLLFTAFGVGGAFTQAIGRLRCLAQGCCHGGVAGSNGNGIRYTDDHSRVVRLARLRDIPLHPTPVYSMLWMIAVGFALLRLWAVGAPLQFIAGIYFILTGLGRFVEEHYRGEPQTAQLAGLRLYQWFAIAFVGGGALISTLGADPAPAFSIPGPGTLPVLFALGAAVYVAYGVDFPRSTRRFSRLT